MIKYKNERHEWIEIDRSQFKTSKKDPKTIILCTELSKHYDLNNEKYVLIGGEIAASIERCDYIELADEAIAWVNNSNDIKCYNKSILKADYVRNISTYDNSEAECWNCEGLVKRMNNSTIILKGN